MKNEKNSSNNKNTKIQNDEVIKSLNYITGKPLIHLINGVFNTDYSTEDDKIVVDSHINKVLVSEGLSILFMDMLIIVKYNEDEEAFHIEYETVYRKKNIFYRMLYYAFIQGIEKLKKDSLKENKNDNKDDEDIEVIFNFPRQCVITIEENKSIKGKKYISGILRMYNPLRKCYEKIVYHIELFNNFEKSIEFLLENHLAILIPFKLSEMNKYLKSKNISDKKLKKVWEKIENLINILLKSLTSEFDKGILSFTEYEHLVNLLNSVYKTIYYKVDAIINSNKNKYKLDITNKEDLGMLFGTFLRQKVEEGKQEGIRETAKNLKNIGILTIEEISRATGLSIKEIQEL